MARVSVSKGTCFVDGLEVTTPECHLQLLVSDFCLAIALRMETS